MESSNQWNSELYDTKLSYVADYGKDVVTLLAPRQGELILDIGCGTGDLTYEIQKSGAAVIGMDSSLDMLKKASEKYPNIQYLQGDATNFELEEKVDAVFSNAALHWVKQADMAADAIFHNLKDGGRFVAEFGGKGNIALLIKGIVDVLKVEHKISASTRIPWYFPSIGEYSTLLENTGFSVSYAHLFDRPTILSDGDMGLDNWLESFADDFFPEFTWNERQNIYLKIKEKVRPVLWKEGKWVVDYTRIRVVAEKK